MLACRLRRQDANDSAHDLRAKLELQKPFSVGSQGSMRMRAGKLRMLAATALLLALCQCGEGRSPVFDDDDEDGGVGRSDQHVASVPLEHSFGV